MFISAATLSFPPLYKHKYGGTVQKIIKWTISVQHEENQSRIFVSFGEINGKMQTHETVITQGKAGRSIKEQSVLEAQSKWNEKKNKEGYEETSSITTSSISPRIFRPMLAKTLDTKTQNKIAFPTFVQRKYDGIRCISFLENTENVVFHTRSGTEIKHFSHLKKILQPVLQLYPEIILDGELYTKEFTFEKLNGLVRTINNINSETEKDMKKVEFFVYDVYSTKLPDLSFENRLKLLNEIIQDNYDDLCMVHRVETITVRSFEELKEKHDQFVQEGFEGIMIRPPNGKYEINKRSSCLWKYKEFMDEEFEIVGFHEGEGIDKGAVIWECKTKDNKFFSVKPRSTLEERKRIFTIAKQYIGKWMTVIFQEYSQEGIPRFPVGKSIV